MKILLICNDYYHPGKVVSDGLAFLRDEGHSMDIQNDAGNFYAHALKDYEVIIFAKSDEASDKNRDKWETAAVQQAFTKFVEDGGGLLALHSGLVGHEGTEELRSLIGCRFTHHPAQCPVTIQPVKEHLITKGIEPYTETDEHYFIDMLAGDSEILMDSVSENGKVPACYTRAQGKGRVCVFTPGHNLSVWQNPGTMQIIRNALQWFEA